MIHGAPPAARISAAIMVGGKSGECWSSPMSRPSETGASVSMIVRVARRSYGGAVRSVSIIGAGSGAGAAGTGSGHDRIAAGPDGSHHGHGRPASSSQDPSPRTPPQGPKTIRFGQPGTGASISVGGIGVEIPPRDPGQTPRGWRTHGPGAP